jgi:hypothetical protein
VGGEPVTTLLLGLGYLTFVSLFLAAVALNVGERSRRRVNRRDLEDRAAARAQAQEGIARHNSRPFVDIDVQPKGRQHG